MSRYLPLLFPILVFAGDCRPGDLRPASQATTHAGIPGVSALCYTSAGKGRNLPALRPRFGNITKPTPMKTRAPLISAAIVSTVLAHGGQAQSKRLGPADIYPDPVRTPGAANPEVTQESIKDNICNPQWSTKLIRPPSEYTSKLKRKQLREYGDTVHQTRAELINPDTGKVDTTRCVARSDNMACYEEDHLIPLEDGGAPQDPRNLWPEPYNTHVGGTIIGARQKDVVEAFIHDEICFDVPKSKKNSQIPATTSITLKRGGRDLGTVVLVEAFFFQLR